MHRGSEGQGEEREVDFGECADSDTRRRGEDHGIDRVGAGVAEDREESMFGSERAFDGTGVWSQGRCHGGREVKHRSGG